LIESVSELNRGVISKLIEREATGRELKKRWPKYDKYVTKVPYVEIGVGMVSGFAAGVFLGPIAIVAALGYSFFGDSITNALGIENKQDYVNDFIAAYGDYMGVADEVIAEVSTNLYPEIVQEMRIYITGFIKQLECAVNEFDEYNLSMEEFSGALSSLIEESNREEE